MSQTTATDPKFFTFDAYLAFDADTDTRYELEDGELVEMPPEAPENNDIVKRIMVELLKSIALDLIAFNTEIEVTGRRAKCRLPDLLVHTAESKAALSGATRATLTRDLPPPALVVEVVSPGATNRARDYRHKHTEYAARGIAEYWIVDPEEQRITVCKWVDGQYEDEAIAGDQIISSDVIPNLAITVAQVFETGH